ncbi:hypothetical protein IIA94_02745, partial [Patescibacteria group bacterium]|nr:hypothetical protein [Patescibacteria group bacterium]
MKKNIVIVAIFAAMLISGGIILSKTGSKTPPKIQEVELESIESADPLPIDIALKDYNSNAVSLVDYIGKP